MDCEGRITYCNDYLLSLTGWQREEVFGRNWFDLFVPPEMNDVRSVLPTCWPTGLGLALRQ